VATDSHTYCGLRATGVHDDVPAWFGLLSWPNEIGVSVFVGAGGIQLSASINVVLKDKLDFNGKPTKKSVPFASGYRCPSYQNALASLLEADLKDDSPERWRQKLQKLVAALPQFP